ncbi:MAG: FprA family A-type flavoprotein [Oscillospiraceae bacterium]|nr:FprA family A-type flavoprotein [Oscillospiraceae bacterium]
MPATKIIDGVYSVGTLNPAMRIFDVVMKTEYGTSYNSYIVRGGEKTALIETCHLTFFDQYVDNIKEVCDPAEIDYIILNHCEPDHSGALRRLLELCPKAQIMVSQAGSIYLKNITNRTDLPIQVAKDRDTLPLGGRTLRFINAPFLHWPDSMFTWMEEDGILFSCDFLGAHFCEPYTFDYNVVYEKKYKEALKGYYDAIFAPFVPYVQKGLEKIKDLDIAFACTSHGPVLTKNVLLPYVIEKYYEWSAASAKEKLQIPVFYCSAYGNSGLLASAIQEGISSVLPEADVEIFDLNEHSMSCMQEKLNGSDAFAVGSPTINADAVPPVWELLSHVDAINCKKRPALVFGSFGWSGEAVPNITARLQGLRMQVFKQPVRAQFVPSEREMDEAKNTAKAFAKQLK